MLSFKSLAVFATLAFGTLSSMAVPLLNNNNVITNAVVGPVARCGCKSLPTILADVQAAVSVHVTELSYLKADNCTSDVIAPIVANIKTSVSSALVDVKALIGADVADVLLSVDGTVQVTADVLAQLVADLLILVFGAVSVCLNLCASASLSVVLTIFVGLGECLGAFVYAIISVAVSVGLDLDILACIGAVVNVIVDLHVSVLASILGISL